MNLSYDTNKATSQKIKYVIEAKEDRKKETRLEKKLEIYLLEMYKKTCPKDMQGIC